MLQKIFLVVGAAFLLSGCSTTAPIGLGAAGGSVWKSFDNGATFIPKVTVNEKQKISSADVLSFVFDPQDPQTAYMGTQANGIFKTTDGAEHWEQMSFPPLKTYGIAVDRNNSSRLYASGIYNEIAKIYRSDDAGKNWKEIYTEPGKGTVITSLGSSPDVPEVLYAGTSAGVVIKSTNGGDTWKNILVSKGAVTKVLFHRGLPDMVTLLVFAQGVTNSLDGGKSWDSYMMQNGVTATSPNNMSTVVADPIKENVLYAGASNGLFRSDDSGKSWQVLPVIESSKKFPARAVAINPSNGNEIIYAAGNAFYRSVDGGTKWATTQLDIDRGVSTIEYEPSHPEIIYFTLRKF